MVEVLLGLGGKSIMLFSPSHFMKKQVSERSVMMEKAATGLSVRTTKTIGVKTNNQIS